MKFVECVYFCQRVSAVAPTLRSCIFLAQYELRNIPFSFSAVLFFVRATVFPLKQTKQHILHEWVHTFKNVCGALKHFVCFKKHTFPGQRGILFHRPPTYVCLHNDGLIFSFRITSLWGFVFSCFVKQSFLGCSADLPLVKTFDSWSLVQY